MKRPLLPVLAFALAALPGAQGLGVGDKLSLGALEGLTQTAARSPAEFYGRAVLLEFFAHWFRPAAASVPRLNGLEAKFGARGLSVVAVTSEAPLKTEPWIQRVGARYAYGYDRANQFLAALGASLPCAVLLDPYGTVVWTGNPALLADAEIEAALSGALARPIWEWPEEARALAGPLARGEYAAALQLAVTLPAQDGLDFTSLVAGRVADLLARFDGLLTRSEFTPALRLGARLELELAGLPEGAALAAHLARMRADPAIVREAEATARLEGLERSLPGIRKLAQLNRLRADLLAFLESRPGSRLEARARELLAQLDSVMEQGQ